MDFYIYAKSGHQVGFDSLKRAVAIYKALAKYNPTLLVSDFRAGEFAKNFGVDRYVSLDVAKNIANVAQRGDVLIYDSNEVGENLIDGIVDHFSLFIRVDMNGANRVNEDEVLVSPFDSSSNLKGFVVDSDYKDDSKSHEYEKAIFFGDDDYFSILVNMLKDSKKANIPLLLGHYFLFTIEDILEEKFDSLIEDEEYIDVIKSTKYLITASAQAALESLNSGNYPIYFDREDRPNINLEIIKLVNIPIVEYKNIDDLILNSEKIIDNYPSLNSIDSVVDDLVSIVDDKMSQEPFKTILEMKKV